MDNSEKQQIFLDYLKDYYLSNPESSISYSKIYDLLKSFNVQKGQRQEIKKINLLPVQYELNKKFQRFRTSSDYFWTTENRNKKTDSEFLSTMYNAIKLYVAVDAENIYNVALKTISLMNENNIVYRSEISKELRNDAFVVRVSSKEEAIKVMKFINSMKYKSNNKPNPFTLSLGNIGMTLDGRLSYNTILSKLLEHYLQQKKNSLTLDNVSLKDLSDFIKKEISIKDNFSREKLIRGYNLQSNYLDKVIDDFISIGNIIIKNIDGTLTIEELLAMQERKLNKKENERHEYSYIEEISENDKTVAKYVLNLLSQYYETEQIHEIVDKYITTGNINYFTRRDNIRVYVYDNFTPDKLKVTLLQLANSALLDVSKDTLDKFNDKQIFDAINALLCDGKLNFFTNDFGGRSRLGLVASKNILAEVLSGYIEDDNFRNIFRDTYPNINLNDGQINDIVNMITKNILTIVD